MRFGPTFRSGRMRPADGRSNGSATLSRIRSLADYTIAMLESSFRKRQRIGCSVNASATFMRPVIHGFSEAFPGVVLRIADVPAGTYSGLLERTYDLLLEWSVPPSSEILGDDVNVEALFDD